MVLVVFPLITIAFLKPALRPALVQSGHPHANGAEHVVPGQAAMSAFFLVSLITFAFFTEHAWATWDRLRASAATSLEIVVGKTLPRVALGIAQFVVIIVGGVVIFDLNIRGNALALAPLVIAFSICLVLLGVAVTAVCRTAQQANSFGYLGMVLFGAIGGAFVPFNLLPGWARDRARHPDLLGDARAACGHPRRPRLRRRRAPERGAPRDGFVFGSSPSPCAATPTLPTPHAGGPF